MATGSPRPPHQSLRTTSGSGSSGSGKSGFSGIFFSLFLLLWTSWDLRVTPPDGQESPNPDPDREIRFFENPDFSIFRLFKLKTLQHGCLLTPLDQPKSPKSPIWAREAACNQSQLFPFIHDKIFVWIQKKESQGCHTAGNLSTIGFLLYDSALCLDPHMESSLTDFVYRAL